MVKVKIFINPKVKSNFEEFNNQTGEMQRHARTRNKS